MANLSAQTVTKLQSIAAAQDALPPAQRNWGSAYTTALQDLQAQAAAGKPVDPGLIYWFQQAIGINANADTPANSFIRSFTTQSASLQGVTLTNQQLQEASGRIGTSVIKDIVGSQGSIPPVKDLASRDIFETFNSPSMAGLNPTITWGGGPFAASRLGWPDYGQGLSSREWAIMTTATANACITTATRYPGSTFSGDGLRECTTAVANLGAATQVLQNDATYRFLKDTFKDAWNWLGQRISADADPSVPAPSALQPMRFFDGASTNGTKLILNLDDGASGDRVLQLDAASGRGTYTGPNGTTLQFALADAQGLGAGASGNISLSLAPGQAGTGAALALAGDGSVRAEAGGSLFGTTAPGASLSLSGGVLSSVGPAGPNGRTDQSFDLSNARSWKIDTKTYDAQGRLDTQSTKHDTGARTDTDHDQDSTKPWTTDTKNYDTQGRLDTQSTKHDTGARTDTDHDQANAAPWSAVSTLYDDRNRADYQTQWNDDRTRVETDHDQASAAPWSAISTSYDDRSRPDYQTQWNDDRTRVETDHDQTNGATWSALSTLYDDRNRADYQTRWDDNGARAETDWDQAGAAAWGTIVTAYDTAGRLDAQNTWWDTGALSVRDWDQAGATAWNIMDTAYDTAGRLDAQNTYWDGGAMTVRDYDQTNAAGWNIIDTAYDSAGRLDAQNVYYDGGSHSVADWDQTGAAPWTHQMTRYDAQGRPDYKTTVFDNGTLQIEEADLLNQYDWHSQGATYDAAGRPVGRTIWFDDGRVANTWFDNDGSAGMIRSRTEQSYNGTLAEHTYAYDDNSARTLRWDLTGSKDWWYADTTYNTGGYVIRQDVQWDNGKWFTYEMGRGGSPVDPGSFWRDATPKGPDYDYNDYDDYGFDDPAGGPGGSGGHYGSRGGGYYYGTPGRDDYIPYVYASDVEYW